MSILAKIFVTFGSSASIAFGVWHFFVPRAWNWYSYIDPNATELIVAVRSINVFFSLSLVLFGLLNLLFITPYGKSIFNNRLADRDLFFVADKDGISSDLPARFVISGSSIRHVGRLCACFFELRNNPDFFRAGEDCGLM